MAAFAPVCERRRPLPRKRYRFARDEQRRGGAHGSPARPSCGRGGGLLADRAGKVSQRRGHIVEDGDLRQGV
jgi:hypothetical protein